MEKFSQYVWRHYFNFSLILGGLGLIMMGSILSVWIRQDKHRMCTLILKLTHPWMSWEKYNFQYILFQSILNLRIHKNHMPYITFLCMFISRQKIKWTHIRFIYKMSLVAIKFTQVTPAVQGVFLEASKNRFELYTFSLVQD